LSSFIVIDCWIEFLSTHNSSQSKKANNVISLQEASKLTNLTFYGAVNEIGGNKILLEDIDSKLFLDFGMSFGTASKYFSEFLQPRKCSGLGSNDLHCNFAGVL
jgi:hypothetical protein